MFSPAAESVRWSSRTAQIRAHDGTVAFECADVEAPDGWSNLAVAIVARRYFAITGDGTPERSVRDLVERVVGAISGWAL
ncbi:MAG: hypothetical protein ACYCXW_19550, partial [Solirubrobacteraceae bacterium]